MTKAAKFLQKVAGLFPGMALEGSQVASEPAPQVAGPVRPPEATTRPEQAPAPQILGPSPLMMDAYADLQATAARMAARATRGLRLAAGPRRLYELLVLVGIGNARARGLANVPTVAEIHMPGELLALALDVHRVTLYRWANELGETVNEETGEVTGAQLVARRDHKTGSVPVAAQAAVEAQQQRAGGKGKGRRRPGVSDGLVWAVSLTGPHPDLQVSAEALRHEWRDLYSDSLAASRNKGSAEGLRTVWALKNRGLQQSLKDLRAQKGEELLVRWTVNPGFSTPPPLSMTVAAPSAGTLSAVWDAAAVRSLAPRERGAAVDSAAQYLAAVMGDTGSVGLYRWVLWRLCRLDTIAVDLWDAVLLTLDQVRGDNLAGDCRSAGAVFMAKLKGSGLWQHLKEAPPHRVGWAA